MTIEEAIKHCEEVAEQNEISAITYKNCKEIKTNMYEKLTAEKAENDCRECAADHGQLAEWLRELKEAKKLLKLAVEDFKTLVLKSTELCNMKILCNECPLNCTNDNLGWKKEAEALKLIGETNDEP